MMKVESCHAYLPGSLLLKELHFRGCIRRIIEGI
jgi:hypothetical protein